MLVLIVVFWLLPDFFRKNELDVEELNAFQNEIDVFYARQQATDSGTNGVDQHTLVDTKRLFYFDPNALNHDGWLQLGLSERTIKTIDNYKAHGGKFYKPEDFKKIFGLKKEEYDRLYPYIRIEKRRDTATRITPNENGKIAMSGDGRLMLNINTADSVEFRKLQGIGPVLSKRIVAYRQKLGGFYTVGQLREVYGLADSVYERIKVNLECKVQDIETININTTEIDVLKEHPYVKYRLAAAVIAYRNQHGAFATLSEIKKVHLVTDEIFEKITPYLVIE